MLSVFDHLPERILDLDAHRLHEVLNGPTLIHIDGGKNPPLFVSVLLHGNETTGWETMRALLRQHAAEGLPRSLSLFIGNVSAAKCNLRFLDGQPDYNRLWGNGDSAEHRMAQAVLEDMRARQPVACIDVHNTSGINPHHAVINRLEPEHLSLAARFGHFVVYAEQRQGTETEAFGEFCPAVVVECGLPNHPGGVEHARAYLDSCVQPGGLSPSTVHRGDIGLYRTVATVKVPSDVEFGFDAGDYPLHLLPHLDELNFNELPEGTVFGEVRSGDRVPLAVKDAVGTDVRDRFFRVEDGRLMTAVPVMPSLVSTNVRIVRQDCLCYLMERMSLPRATRRASAVPPPRQAPF